MAQLVSARMMTAVRAAAAARGAAVARWAAPQLRAAPAAARLVAARSASSSMDNNITGQLMEQMRGKIQNALDAQMVTVEDMQGDGEATWALGRGACGQFNPPVPTASLSWELSVGNFTAMRPT